MLELGKVVNGGAEWVCRSPFAGGALQNPVITGMLLTVLVLIIVCVMNAEAAKATTRTKAVKTTFWVFMAVTMVVFVHYYGTNLRITERTANEGVRNTFNAINASAATGGGYSVYGSGELADVLAAPAMPAMPASPAVMPAVMPAAEPAATGALSNLNSLIMDTVELGSVVSK